MEIAFHVSVGVSVVVFLFYGLGLLSDGMVAEFERYGLSSYRRLTGILEVLGAAGLVVGYFLLPVLVLASAGLTVLMALAVATRIRVRDSAAETIPAFGLMLVNAYILVYALRFSV
jgi:hypothetical protein